MTPASNGDVKGKEKKKEESGEKHQERQFLQRRVHRPTSLSYGVVQKELSGQAQPCLLRLREIYFSRLQTDLKGNINQNGKENGKEGRKESHRESRRHGEKELLSHA